MLRSALGCEAHHWPFVATYWAPAVALTNAPMGVTPARAPGDCTEFSGHPADRPCRSSLVKVAQMNFRLPAKGSCRTRFPALPWMLRAPLAGPGSPQHLRQHQHLGLKRQNSQQVACGALQVREIRTFAVKLSCDGDVLHGESICSCEGRLPAATNFFSSCYAYRSHLCVSRRTGERESSTTHRLTASEDRTKSRSAMGLPESCALAPAHRYHRAFTYAISNSAKRWYAVSASLMGVAQHCDPKCQLQVSQYRHRLHSRAGPCRPERSGTLVLRDTRRTSLIIRNYISLDTALSRCQARFRPKSKHRTGSLTSNMTTRNCAARKSSPAAMHSSRSAAASAL